ncbi:MAG TPA: 4-hydroxythreonine-4-phosphate dehydrogenase PdxA [Patescibacteria group bacterium]|nr:4-hydroxythreonine-4-phosphate dehydrogenase PdxA [Patescibacteria group bacterium]
MKPLIGITMGDGAGIGPEIIVKALTASALHIICRPVVIGNLATLRKAAVALGLKAEFRKITRLDNAGTQPLTIDVIDLDNLPADLPWGKVSPVAGKAAYEYAAKATQMALAGKLQAIVTAPLNKKALRLGGMEFPGHGEIFAYLSGVKKYAMLLVGGSLQETIRVIHVTEHMSLRQACEKVCQQSVMETIEMADYSLKLLGIPHPRIAVAGLNPHGGEDGLFGNEEIAEIIPAVKAMAAKGYQVRGPFPADTVFYRAVVRQEFDIVVAMYHDQGLIPFKLLGFETGVNVTVGLPFVRTAVSHGTAFDQAGKGVADCRSLTEAIRLATLMVRNAVSVQPPR